MNEKTVSAASYHRSYYDSRRRRGRSAERARPSAGEQPQFGDGSDVFGVGRAEIINQQLLRTLFSIPLRQRFEVIADRVKRVPVCILVYAPTIDALSHERIGSVDVILQRGVVGILPRFCKRKFIVPGRTALDLDTPREGIEGDDVFDVRIVFKDHIEVMSTGMGFANAIYRELIADRLDVGRIKLAFNRAYIAGRHVTARLRR